MKSIINYLVYFSSIGLFVLSLTLIPAHASSKHKDSEESYADDSCHMQSEAMEEDAESPDGYQIDINTASVKELRKLKGIGKAKALAIVSYREKNGPFMDTKDLLKIKGVGKAVLKKNKDTLCVSRSDEEKMDY